MFQILHNIILAEKNLKLKILFRNTGQIKKKVSQKSLRLRQTLSTIESIIIIFNFLQHRQFSTWLWFF